MKIQVHSSNNRTFCAPGSCHMIIPKKCHQENSTWSGMSQQWQQDLKDSDTALSNVRLGCPRHLAQPHKGENRPAMVTEQVRGHQGELCSSAIPHLTAPHSLLGPTRTHADTCTKGPGRDAGNLWAGKPQAAQLKLLKKIIFFKSPKTHTNTLGPHIQHQGCV